MKLTDEIKHRFQSFWASNGGNWGPLQPIFDVLAKEDREPGEIDKAFSRSFSAWRGEIAEGRDGDAMNPLIKESHEIGQILQKMDMKTRLLVAATCAQAPAHRLSIGPLDAKEYIAHCVQLRSPMTNITAVDEAILMSRRLDRDFAAETARRSWLAQFEAMHAVRGEAADDADAGPKIDIPDGPMGDLRMRGA